MTDTRPRNSNDWKKVDAEVVTDTNTADGTVSIPSHLTESFPEGSPAVIRLPGGHRHLQCKVTLNASDPPRLKISDGAGRSLGLQPGTSAFEIRKRRTTDGMGNLMTKRGIATAAPFLVAILAIVPGVIWPAPSGSDAAQVNAIWQKVEVGLASRQGGASGQPLENPSAPSSKTSSADQNVIAQLTAAEIQASAVEATFSNTEDIQQRNHNRATVIQIILAAILAFILFFLGARRVYAGP